MVAASEDGDMMDGMTEDDSTAGLDLWWQALTDDERARFRDLKEDDPFPKEHLSAYSRASLVAGAQPGEHLLNNRLGGFIANKRGEQK
jgi:hypothetical protein